MIAPSIYLLKQTPISIRKVRIHKEVYQEGEGIHKEVYQEGEGYLASYSFQTSWKKKTLGS